MQWGVRAFRRLKHGRRLTSASVLVVYLATATGVPLPLPTQQQTGAEQFPCMAGHCGCHTAEQCWRSCCCHSLAERLAWARQRGVQPPDFALAQARAAGLIGRELADAGQPCDDKTACCSAHQKKLVSFDADLPDASLDEQVNATAEKTNSIIAWRALACRGQSASWLAAVPALILVGPPSSDLHQLVMPLSPSAPVVAPKRSDAPPVPPPEHA
jgi:hypothetical protein